MKRDWEVIEARVDWITITQRVGTPGDLLLDLGAKLLSKEREDGNKCSTRSFEGYYGSASAHVFSGWRLDGACVRLGGGMARDFWRDAARLATNVSRVDIAVTAISSPPDDHLASESWSRIPNRPSTGGRPTDYSLIQARLGGETLYCGSRSSEKFGRLYDKHRESRGQYPPGAWRFEVEYKGDDAKVVTNALLESENEANHIGLGVAARFRLWGVEVPWTPPPGDWVDTANYTPTTNETRFKWLGDTVRSTVENLSLHYSGEELRKALGLQQTSIPPIDSRIAHIPPGAADP